MTQLETHVQPHIPAHQWQGLVQLAEQEMTLERFQALLAQRLESLDWDRDTWYETSLFFADWAQVAGHKKREERERVRNKYSDLSQPTPVRQIIELNQQVIQQMAVETAPKLEAFVQTGGTL